MTPVNYFGERALLEADPRNASVYAKNGKVECLEMHRTAFAKAFGPAQDIIARESRSQPSADPGVLRLMPLGQIAEGQVRNRQILPAACRDVDA